MNRRLPNLKQLRAFEAAARHLSFKRAADELAVSQAAISHQIKGLEDYFECRLFNRHNRRVALTEAAVELAGELTTALDQIARASNAFLAKKFRGKLRISVTPFYAKRMILPYLHEFLKAHSGLEIEFDYSYEISNFSKSGVNGAIRYGMSDRTDARMRIIHYDRVAPVASRAFAADVKLPMSASQIAGLPLAAVREQKRYWFKWFAKAGVTDPQSLSWSMHDQRALALDAALSGNAVALADLPLIRNELANGSLVRLSDVEITLDRGIHLAEPPGPFDDPRLLAFGDWLETLVHDFSRDAMT